MMIVFAVEYQMGNFDRFWLWTVDYAREYAAEVSWTLAGKLLAVFVPRIIKPIPLLVGLMFCGLAALMFDSRGSTGRTFMGFWVLASVFSLGSRFWPHAFIASGAGGRRSCGARFVMAGRSDTTWNVAR